MAYVVADVSQCRYEVVKDALLAAGFTIAGAPQQASPAHTQNSSSIKGPSDSARSLRMGTGRSNSTTTAVSNSQTVPPSAGSAGREGVPLLWSDCTFTPARVAALHQRRGICNHFPGIEAISRKLGLAAALTKYSRHFPQHFNFFPLSFTSWLDYTAWRKSEKESKAAAVMLSTASANGKAMPVVQSPGDLSTGNALLDASRNNNSSSSNTTAECWYICKPTAGCQGRGVVLTDKVTMKSFFSADPMTSNGGGEPSDPSKRDMVVQVYIDRPLLIDGRKCDLRCYVLVTSFDPLEVFFYEEGIVRVCRTAYEPPTHDNHCIATMHYANYAVNKQHTHQLRDDQTVTATRNSAVGLRRTSSTTRSTKVVIPKREDKTMTATAANDENTPSTEEGDVRKGQEEDADAKAVVVPPELKQSFRFLNRVLEEHMNLNSSQRNADGCGNNSAKGHPTGRSLPNGTASTSTPTTTLPTTPIPHEEAQRRIDAVWHEIHLVVLKTILVGQDAVVRALPFNPNRHTIKTSSSPSSLLASTVSGSSSSRASSLPDVAASGCRTSFEVLGFDIMLDTDLKPWLIEVNHSPSWATDTTSDYDLKYRVIREAMGIVKHTHALRQRVGVRGAPTKRRGGRDLPQRRQSAPTETTTQQLNGATRSASPIQREQIGGGPNATAGSPQPSPGDQEGGASSSSRSCGASAASNRFLQIYPNSKMEEELKDLLRAQAEMLDLLTGRR